MNIRHALAGLAILVASGAPAVTHAIEAVDEPVMLVAKPALRDRIYGATILIAKPASNGRHIGFIINKPTPLTLGRLFPDHEPSQKVTEPVYLGGPMNTSTLFALVQRKDNPGRNSVQFAPGLYVVLERDLVDQIIEAEAERARFLAGLVLWAPGELREEIRRGFWYVIDADAGLALRKPTDGMWEELVKRSEQNARSIRAAL